MLSFELGYQVVGETQVMERLCQDRSGVLRLAGRVPPACG